MYGKGSGSCAIVVVVLTGIVVLTGTVVRTGTEVADVTDVVDVVLVVDREGSVVLGDDPLGVEECPDVPGVVVPEVLPD